jgi:hypothetical protein
VDEIVRLWSKARPDLDPEPMAPIGRILRLARQFDRELAPVYRAKGLDFGLFDVLATLRRIGPPYRLTPGELDDWCNQQEEGAPLRAGYPMGRGLRQRIRTRPEERLVLRPRAPYAGAKPEQRARTRGSAPQLPQRFSLPQD